MAHDGSGRDDVSDDLAVRLSEVARSLSEGDDVDQTLRAIVRAAMDTIPGVQHAGVMVVERRRQVHTRAATDDLVFRVDRAQFEADEGPCLDTVHEVDAVRSPGICAPTGAGPPSATAPPNSG